MLDFIQFRLDPFNLHCLIKLFLSKLSWIDIRNLTTHDLENSTKVLNKNQFPTKPVRSSQNSI